jgi:hypothetical protein
MEFPTTSILLTDTTVGLRAHPNPVGGDGYTFGFDVVDNGTEVVGCLRVNVSGTIIQIWGLNSAYFPAVPTKAINVISSLLSALLPHLSLGVSLPELKANFKNNQACAGVKITSKGVPDGSDYDLFLEGSKSPEDVLNKYVYGGDWSNAIVRREILKRVYIWEKDRPHEALVVGELQRMLFIPLDIIQWQLKYLAGAKKVSCNATAEIHTKVSLLHAGRMEVEGDEKEVAAGSPHIFGDYVAGDKNIANTHGDKSPIISNSHDIRLIYGDIDGLKRAIDSDYEGDDKQQLIDDVERLRASVSDGHTAKARAILGNLLARSAEVGTIVLAILGILQQLPK